ncbi:MAG: PSD1 and planctomycete cytochrome C domain-containing protein [Planctomycetota bacterium]|nr:PSD1 and planctomycete cytochrome C domain-containing protein [Planctomycetota bacterium]
MLDCVHAARVVLMLGCFAGSTAASVGDVEVEGEEAPGPVAGEDVVGVRYGRDIRPLLSDRCFQCHGADASSRQAGLRLDMREHALADLGGYAAVVPGDLEASELWRRITSDDPDVVMPPPQAKRRALSNEDRAHFARWIKEGAAYEAHWSFVAPVMPELPAVIESSWVRDPLDTFVLARLEAAGVQPSPRADAATMARRLFLDLTGLPPSVEELDIFLEECGGEGNQTDVAVDDAAYVALVDRLLTQEPWRSRVAERLATPWMDAARYADTIGIHTDAGRQMWLWRDWVLSALRDNLPYDRFVIEQLAGDLLPEASVQQRTASGFNRNHVITDEGGAIDEEYLLEYAVDRVNTTSAVFLGLTVGCARCHDHKFDPVTQEDYYGLLAFFNSNDEPGLYSQTPDSNRAYEPSLRVPTAEQEERLAELDATITELTTQLEAPIPGEKAKRADFLAGVRHKAGLDWTAPQVVSADSSDAEVSLVLQEDGAVLAEGPLPMEEDYELVLATEETDLRVLLLEALAIPGQAGAGRAGHGNAVLTSLTLDVRDVRDVRPTSREENDESSWQSVPLIWAWSDHTQTNYDHEPTRLLDPGHDLGWALDGNDAAGPRNLLLLSAEPFGEAGGSELRVRMAFRSPYTQHSLGRIRMRVSPLSDTSAFEPSHGRWWRAGPFARPEGAANAQLYETSFGPETGEFVDRGALFGEEKRKWSFDGSLLDAEISSLGSTVGVSFVSREIWSPDARELEVALGSDDGVAVFHDGRRVFENRVNRGPDLDQDRVALDLHPGRNTIVLKIVNTGGPTSFAWESQHPEGVLIDELGSALLPENAVTSEQSEDFSLAWRRLYFDGYRTLDDARIAAREQRVSVEQDVPQTMVMSELKKPRETFVMMRGQYDHPDKERPVQRGVPDFLPPMPEGAEANRHGFAQWLVTPEQPLFARVAVNRFWELLFGEGLVGTSQDFGMQGAWPTHPDLLDWLAVQFRTDGWNVRELLRHMVTSATYRQSSVIRDDLAVRDPENRLLARYPRRRLDAEQIRDMALASSGLLVERFGGPSVKPYQPEGLWKEVSMPQSNTANFERGAGEDLRRRSLYTYWKRAVPPPAMLTLDAPTRESCVISRQATNTPLQALLLWNDEQFVEAARSLAERTWLLGGESDSERLVWLMRTCSGRHPDADEVEILQIALDEFRARFASEEVDVEALLAVGETSNAMEVPGSELAAWTMLSSAVMNLHETLTQD